MREFFAIRFVDYTRSMGVHNRFQNWPGRTVHLVYRIDYDPAIERF